jgi:hypothetical protein
MFLIVLPLERVSAGPNPQLPFGDAARAFDPLVHHQATEVVGRGNSARTVRTTRKQARMPPRFLDRARRNQMERPHADEIASIAAPLNSIS